MRISFGPLFVFLICSFSLPTNSMVSNNEANFSKIVEEEDIFFYPKEEILTKGEFRIFLDIPHSSEIKEKFDPLIKLDFPKVSDLKSVKFFTGKYAYNVPKDISRFRREEFHTEKGFLLLAKKTRVTEIKERSFNYKMMRIQKDITLFTLTADVDYGYYSREEFPGLAFHDSIHEVFAPFSPEIITIQHGHDFNRLFKETIHICSFTPGSGRNTLVYCYILAAMDLGAYNRTRWLIDARKKFKEDMVFYARNILNKI